MIPDILESKSEIYIESCDYELATIDGHLGERKLYNIKFEKVSS